MLARYILTGSLQHYTPHLDTVSFYLLQIIKLFGYFFWCPFKKVSSTALLLVSGDVETLSGNITFSLILSFSKFHSCQTSILTQFIFKSLVKIYM